MEYLVWTPFYKLLHPHYSDRNVVIFLTKVLQLGAVGAISSCNLLKNSVEITGYVKKCEMPALWITWIWGCFRSIPETSKLVFNSIQFEINSYLQTVVIQKAKNNRLDVPQNHT